MHLVSCLTLVSFCFVVSLSVCEYHEAHPSLSLPKSTGPSHGNETHDIFFKFVTRPDIVVPKWDIHIHEPKTPTSPGFWFIAPYADRIQTTYESWNGPLIYDEHGELIWTGVSMFKQANVWDFRTTEINERHMISLLDYRNHTGFVLDEYYQTHTTFSGVGQSTIWDSKTKGYLANEHGFTVIANGSRALMLTRHYEWSTVEESRVVGFDGNCAARWEGFREVDLTTGKTLFEWNAHHHMGLDESNFQAHIAAQKCKGNLSDAWDILHINSVDKFPDGDYLISIRHTDTVYRISHIDGSIVWRLGGKKSDFEALNEDAKFSRQHHARFLSQNETHIMISLLDNAKGKRDKWHPPTRDQSRGLILALHMLPPTMTVEAMLQLEHPEHLLLKGRGSVQVLPNNNVFVGWADASRITEHAPDGRVLLDAKLRKDQADTYRAYKYPWIGWPLTRPDVNSTVIGVGKQRKTLVHVSWNGATEVKTWKVYSRNTIGGAEEFAASRERQGFETGISFDGEGRYVVAEAIDSAGSVLGRSETFATIGASQSTMIEIPAVAILLGLLCIVVALFALWFARSLLRCTISEKRSREKRYTYVPVDTSDVENGEVVGKG